MYIKYNKFTSCTQYIINDSRKNTKIKIVQGAIYTDSIIHSVFVSTKISLFFFILKLILQKSLQLLYGNVNRKTKVTLNELNKR